MDKLTPEQQAELKKLGSERIMAKLVKLDMTKKQCALLIDKRC